MQMIGNIIRERYRRWIDFENDYRTMYPSFMKTCWRIFKQIFDKGRVYRKCKVMPFSWAINIVLSNFEAGSDYREIDDLSVIITFPMIKDPKKNFRLDNNSLDSSIKCIFSSLS